MRRSAKAVNFGVIYGQSPFGLAKSLRIEQSDAALFIDRYFEGYPGVDAFLLQTLAECRRDGYVSTILGRRRPVTDQGGGEQACRRALAVRPADRRGDAPDRRGQGEGRGQSGVESEACISTSQPPDGPRTRSG